MKKTLGIAVLAATAAALACKSLPPAQAQWDPKADFSRLKTFAWSTDPKEDKGVGSSIVDPRWVNDHVQGAVDAELTKKGYRKVAEGADFLLDYHTQPGAVLSQDRWGYYSWYSPAIYAGTVTRREATLAIDVRDKGMRLIWRGGVTKLAGSTPEKLDSQIKDAIAEVMAKFPPPPPGAPAKS